MRLGPETTADGVTEQASLYRALGSAEKTLHVNPGRHVEIPVFERDSWERFYARHLVVPAPV